MLSSATQISLWICIFQDGCTVYTALCLVWDFQYVLKAIHLSSHYLKFIKFDLFEVKSFE